MRAMLDYDWPGNIRELANVLERAQILADDNVITPDDLPDGMHAALAPSKSRGPQSLSLDALERSAVRAALEQFGGNKVHAAVSLGISRRRLYRLMNKHLPNGLQASGPDSDEAR